MSGLAQIWGYFETAIVFMVVLTVLVAVHELGHFWFARMFGMRVDAFAVMMGGRRSTDLRPYLRRPLAPTALVWAGYAIAVLLVLAGSLGRVDLLYTLGLALLAVPLPLWVAVRIGALYHQPLLATVKSMGYSWLAFLGILFVATRLKGVGVNEVLTLLFFGSLIGLLMVYYHPVAHKPEDAPMGRGEIALGDDAGGDEGPERVEVRFRPLLSRIDRHGTEFSLLALPLGGFAAIHGMHPKDDGSETRIESGFYSKSPLARFLVLLAGPLFSVLFGVVLLVGLFTMVGVEKPVNEARFGAVLSGKPADRAGLKPGDRVLSVDAKPVQTWYELISEVRDRPGMPLRLVVERGSRQFAVTVTPEKDAEPTPVLGPDLEPTAKMRVQGKIGAAISTRFERVPFGEAWVRAGTAPVAMVAGLLSLATQPSRAKEEFGGPASVVTLTHTATSEGLPKVITLAAMLSVSLGIMNLLPFPPLDGGQMVIAFVEMLRRGRRLSMQVQHVISTVGMLLVMALVVGVAMLDVSRFVGGPK